MLSVGQALRDHCAAVADMQLGATIFNSFVNVFGRMHVAAMLQRVFYMRDRKGPFFIQ